MRYFIRSKFCPKSEAPLLMVVDFNKISEQEKVVMNQMQQQEYYCDITGFLEAGVIKNPKTFSWVYGEDSIYLFQLAKESLKQVQSGTWMSEATV